MEPPFLEATRAWGRKKLVGDGLTPVSWKKKKEAHLVTNAGHVAHAPSVALVVEVFVDGAEALERVLRGHEHGAQGGAVCVAELVEHGRGGTGDKTKRRRKREADGKGARASGPVLSLPYEIDGVLHRSCFPR